MQNITEENLTQVVLDRTNTDDPRQNEIITKLIKHVHAFIRDLEPTEQEWFQAVDFLTRTGQMCDDKRQEFILLSDVLGVSMLVDAINHRGMGSATETTVTGPFHASAMPLEMGANVFTTASEQSRGGAQQRKSHQRRRRRAFGEGRDQHCQATSVSSGSSQIADTKDRN